LARIVVEVTERKTSVGLWMMSMTPTSPLPASPGVMQRTRMAGSPTPGADDWPMEYSIGDTFV
jgi:hypothetical protein